MALAALLLLIVGGCGTGSETETQPVRVQVFIGAYSSIPVHVADERGYFRRHGLEVELLSANSSSAAIAALIGGSMDIVESAPDLVMANIDKGIELKFLAGNESSSYVTLVAGNHVPLPDGDAGYAEIMQHLVGYRIGVNAIGSTVYLAAVLMLEDAGLSADDVDFVATGSAATTLSAWQAEAVDAQMTFAPVPELLETLGVARPVLVLADDGPPAVQFRGLFSGWVTSAAFLERDSARAEAFIAALRDAIDWIRDPANHEEMVGLASRYAPIAALSETENRQVLDAMVSNYRRYWGYEISPAAIELWNDYARRFGLIDERIAFGDIVHEAAPVCGDPC
ncbi:MAG: ABC transporter substrate-binding protein [Gammaproteobacteria bacterium]|nr:ABC transporter substrate-binding protein [Gammaproteobacteria bacterium]